MTASKMKSTLKTGQGKIFQTFLYAAAESILNERIISCFVQGLADDKVSRKDVAGIIMKKANTIFGQHWSESAELPKTFRKTDQ